MGVYTNTMLAEKMAICMFGKHGPVVVLMKMAGGSMWGQI